ncbi:E3 ubiquitin-protein ligase Topors isoform X2 [Acyrthosiphon pisum]|uniref:RING-type E3 ubiquitin transferase n=1 Tax=Acyrthosiphon pisum TaxID=7029 RepID=A0A8R1X3U6_ACYPI|nr:E3 ubiquitin-protein ligase Topors isoform X2 [Acyrthosiphon pisum]|eukprot:XP_008180259.1 PREDICTED: E3 ubiquitin-protein ligase Topors isoform X2 [Acyrthosiphon pisum]
MSVIIKSEPISGVVELSSDDEETVSTLSTINNVIPNNRPTGCSSPDSHCSICLDDLTNKCYTNSCWHLFCFECLQRWSNSEATCPLCKKSFNSIYHSFDNTGFHETYNVPTLANMLTPRIYIRPMSDLAVDIDRMNMFMDIVRRNERMSHHPIYDLDDVDHNQNGMSPFIQELSDDYPSTTLQRPISGQAMRIRVYMDDAWALPLPDMTGRFRDCSSAFYRDNPAQTYRLHAFILRDLVAVRESVRLDDQSMPIPASTDVTVTNLIMRSLAAYEIRQLHLVNVLRPFLHMRAVHFCHELYNFANSPYDIAGYDHNVRFTYPPHDSELTRPHYTELLPPIHILGETIVLDSDNEEVIRPRIMEVIEVSSSPDDSDVEILSHSFHSIDPLNSASIDQPSTSTGIRDSLDRPNNRYNLRRRRIFSPTVNDSSSFPVYGNLSRISYPSQVRRGRPMLDSSSDDEESVTATRGSQTALIKSRNVNDKRKKKTKRNKKKKRKINTNDSRSETRSTNRNRSYSGSSSSSGETDIRPFNGCILRI